MMLQATRCLVVVLISEQVLGRRLALVVRGVPYRDCGHGRACDAISEGPQRWCAESHLRHFIEPAESSGFTVDVFVASYQCVGREDWTRIYRNGLRSVTTDFLDSALAEKENQLDSMLRALKLLDPRREEYSGVLVTRNDLLLLTDLTVLFRKENTFWFHADMTDGAAVALRKPHTKVTAVTDKLHYAAGASVIQTFIHAVETGECFNNGDDDDPLWISAEHCSIPMTRRLGENAIAFMRDHIGSTDTNTFGDNQIGDGVYLVIPRALGSLSPSPDLREEQVSTLLQSTHPYATTIHDLWPYISGHCYRGGWKKEVHHAQTTRNRRRHPGTNTSSAQHVHHRRKGSRRHQELRRQYHRVL